MTSPRGAAPARVTHNGIDARAESRPRRAARLRKRRKVASTNSSQSRGLAISACDHSETHATNSVFNASGKGRGRQAASLAPGGGLGGGGVTVRGGGRSRASTPARKTAVHVGSSWGLPPRRRGVGMVGAAGAVDRSRRRRGAQESRRFTMMRRTSVCSFPIWHSTFDPSLQWRDIAMAI
jgi:hypothetical protein